MGVAVQLGLGPGLGSEVLVEAAGRWSSWVGEVPVLEAVGGLPSLPGWLRAAEPARADEVLLGLVRLGSPMGSGEVAASGVVAWALLPGACTLARRLRPVSGQVDVLVAAQLWLEVRSFEWWRLRKVAANVLARTRCQVLADCGVSSQVRRSDPTWAATSVHDPLSASWVQCVDQSSESGQASAVELGSLLEEADAGGLLSRLERLMLDRLLVHADELGGTRAGRGRGGLLADRLVAVVAEEVGVSPATVRRRTRRVVGRLAEAHRAGLVAA
jgi:hypothetical protein